ANHKVDPHQWLTIDIDNYRFSCNDQQKCNAYDTVKLGTYNLLIGQTNYCPGLSGLLDKVDPTNKMIEIYGMCKTTINKNYQIQDLQVFYDPNQLFTQLIEISSFAPFARLNFQASSQSKLSNQNGKMPIHKEKQQSVICTIL
ncbi:unnamed protein product, partial [Rotaria socialis]